MQLTCNIPDFEESEFFNLEKVSCQAANDTRRPNIISGTRNQISSEKRGDTSTMDNCKDKVTATLNSLQGQRQASIQSSFDGCSTLFHGLLPRQHLGSFLLNICRNIYIMHANRNV